MKKLYFLIASLIVPLASGAASLSYTQPMPTPLVGTMDEAGTTYAVVTADSIAENGKPGEPSLPVAHIQFSVPYNAYGFQVAAVGNGAQAIQLEHPLYPIQEPEMGDVSFQRVFTPPSVEIYGQDAAYPQSLAKVADEGFLDGDNHIVTVAIHSADYNPMQNLLRTYQSVSVTLTYSVGSSPTAMRAITRLSTVGKAEALRAVSKMVVNPLQVSTFAAPAKSRSVSEKSSSGLPSYEYCVITSRSLAAAFRPLVDWKRQKGYKAGVVCIEDILSDPAFANGDEIFGADGEKVSSINDDAGKLRAYLRRSYTEGVGKYVLLGGDYTVLPIRYGHYNSGDSTEFHDYVPADLYFSDLNGNWNVNDDGYYGEQGKDKIDRYSELYVGRLLCTTKDEVGNYIEKLFRYELNPGNGDYSYLKRAFISQCDEMLAWHQGNDLEKFISGTYSTITRFDESPSAYDLNPTFPTGVEVVSELNSTRYGFICPFGHGNSTSIGVLCSNTMGKDGWAYGEFLRSVKIDVEHKENGLNCLTNYDYPAIMMSSSCTLAPFDENKDSETNYRPNFGASYTTNGLYGGPAFVGNTRAAYIISNFALCQLFLTQLLQSVSFGESLAIAKSKYTGDYSELFKLSIIGDPEFEMWTEMPTRYKNLTISRSNSSITVSGEELQGSTVALAGSGVDSEQRILSESTSCLINDIDPNSIVTVYRHNAIPIVLPVKLQNGSWGRTVRTEIMVNDMAIGSEVDANRTKGSYMFGTGCNAVINANGAVELHPGFKVEDNAVLTINSKKKVTIYGGDLIGTAKLNINAPVVNIVKNFKAKKGTILSINKN